MSGLGGIASEKDAGSGWGVGGGVGASAVAAGAGDNTETDGAAFDRLPAPDSAQRHESGAFVLACQATLADGETATYTVTIQESADGSTGWADIPASEQPAASFVQTGGTGGTTEQDVFKHNLRFTKRQRYLRGQVLVDLSAGATDVAAYGGGFVGGGSQKVPV